MIQIDTVGVTGEMPNYSVMVFLNKFIHWN